MTIVHQMNNCATRVRLVKNGGGKCEGRLPRTAAEEKIALGFAPFDCRYNLWG